MSRKSLHASSRIILFMCSCRWNASTWKHTIFMQCIEYLGKPFTIRNPVHRKTTDVILQQQHWYYCCSSCRYIVHQHTIFGICEGVLHFSQHTYNVTINSHNSQVVLHTSSYDSNSGTVQWGGGRTILGAKSKLLYSKIAHPGNCLE
jgi:hypothetical protein